MSGRRKPRDPEAVKPSGMSLADYKASGALDTPLPTVEYMVYTADGRQFACFPHTPTGWHDAAESAILIGGTVKDYRPVPTSYWKTGEAHYDH